MIEKNSERCSGAARYISSEEFFSFFLQTKFKTLQLFVPNSKRLRGYT
jgi:hypothetical protein